MNKITLKSALFFILFAIAFTSCKEDEDKDVPVITLSGANPLTLDTINSAYNEPGASTSEGTIIVDKSALYLNKRGEYSIYYSAVDGADNIGHATRKVIVRNPADQVEGTYNVAIKDITTGNTVELYVDNITADDYTNGKFTFSNFDASCGFSQTLIGKYDWQNTTVDIAAQTYNSQPLSNNTGSAFAVTLNGSDVTFTMDITIGSTTKRYVYTKRNPETATSSIMAIHVSPDAPGVDVLVDNEKATSAALAYASNSAYITADAGDRNVKVNPAGTCTPVINSVSNYEANKYYSLFVVDYVANLDAIKLEDDLSNPAAGNARVRFLHAAPGAVNVDINVAGGPTVFPNVGFKQSSTGEVASGNYSFDVFEAGTSNLIFTTGSINFANGRVYTVYAMLETNGSVGVRLIVNK